MRYKSLLTLQVNAIVDTSVHRAIIIFGVMLQKYLDIL